MGPCPLVDYSRINSRQRVLRRSSTRWASSSGHRQGTCPAENIPSKEVGLRSATGPRGAEAVSGWHRQPRPSDGGPRDAMGRAAQFRELSAFAVSQRDRIVTDDQGEVALTSPDQLAVSGILHSGAVVSFQT